jgi:hypothetical protein
MFQLPEVDDAGGGVLGSEARICPREGAASVTWAIFRITCDCWSSAASAALAPAGAGVTQLAQAACSAARTLSGLPPCAVNHACAAMMVPWPLLSAESAVTHPTHAVAPCARTPRLDWNPSTAPVTVAVLPVPGSFFSEAPLLSSPHGLSGPVALSMPWNVGGTRLPKAIVIPLGPHS